MAERFFCPDAARGGRLTLDGDEARHLVRVRRVGAGGVVELFDGQGFATLARVSAVDRGRVELVAEGDPLPDRAPACKITLAAAVPKGDRFDWLVEKATELGVARLRPLRTERSVVDPRQAKLDRLRRAVVEASKQCGRNRLMAIDPPSDWSELLTGTQADAWRLVAHPGGEAFFEASEPVAGRAVVAVGPEGGFTEAEVDAARRAGWGVVGLGPTVLRVETAAVAACVRVLDWAERATRGGDGG